ncbi:MAG: hypothetical protein JKP90_04840 [Desulfofustis sp. PB-SRB1]|nr:hypothetical protein [Desulfofustis sp. PB-SRB1]
MQTILIILIVTASGLYVGRCLWLYWRAVLADAPDSCISGGGCGCGNGYGRRVFPIDSIK